MSETTIIEVNGVKMEVDLRQAKVINNYKVGDHIKVLIKEYGDNFTSYIGTIIGFDNFKNLPTIVIAYMKCEYNSAGIQFAYFNSKSTDIEITDLNDWDIPITREDMINKFDKEITEKELALSEAQGKKDIFNKLFNKYFDDIVK